MKRYFSIFIMFFLPFVALAQKEYKLEGQSAKERPNWVESSDPYLFIEYKAKTLDDAKNAVLKSLKNQIASSVATVIDSESTTTTETDGSDFKQETESVIKVKVAKIPALQGVDLSKADIYWEKYYNKKTKEYSFDYYVLYPFTPFDLQELVDAYNAQEKAINDKIENYRNSLDKINSVEVLLENISQMKAMKEVHKDDLNRVSQLDIIISLYEKYLKNVYIEVVENSNRNNEGTLVIQLMHGEKVMTTKSLPQLRSECARDFTRKHSGDQIIITFNTFDCYEQDDNYVEIRLTIGKKKLIKKVNINV